MWGKERFNLDLLLFFFRLKCTAELLCRGDTISAERSRRWRLELDDLFLVLFLLLVDVERCSDRGMVQRSASGRTQSRRPLRGHRKQRQCSSGQLRPVETAPRAVAGRRGFCNAVRRLRPDGEALHRRLFLLRQHAVDAPANDGWLARCTGHRRCATSHGYVPARVDTSSPKISNLFHVPRLLHYDCLPAHSSPVSHHHHLFFNTSCSWLIQRLTLTISLTPCDY